MFRVSSSLTFLAILHLAFALQIPNDGIYGDTAGQNDVSDDMLKERQIASPTEEYLQHLIMNDSQRSKKNFDEIDRAGFPGFYSKKSNIKRHFDEIDVSGFQDFDKKNFDEIDASGFRGFSKKYFEKLSQPGFDDFGKRNFDEIDASGFRGFDKKNFNGGSNFYDFGKYHNFRVPNLMKINRLASRNSARNNLINNIAERFQKKNFDEIDRAGFPGFNKRY